MNARLRDEDAAKALAPWLPPDLAARIAGRVNPFGVASVLGWATPFLSMLMAYAFFGLDVLGDEMEEPFGREENDLPLDALTRTVEIELLDALDVKPLPPPLLPERYVLT